MSYPSSEQNALTPGSIYPFDSELPDLEFAVLASETSASQQISVAIGTAALATVAADRAKILTGMGHHHLQALTGGFHLGSAVAAGAVGVGVVVALLSLRPPRRLAAVVAVHNRQLDELEQEAA